MDLMYGFMLDDNQIVPWNVSISELESLCKNIKIGYSHKSIPPFDIISLPINFANLGIVRAAVHFKKNAIYQLNISAMDECLNAYKNVTDRFIDVNNKMIVYLGHPKYYNKTMSIWKLSNIKIKHYLIKRDDALMDYLVINRN